MNNFMELLHNHPTGTLATVWGIILCLSSIGISTYKIIFKKAI